MSDLSEIQSSQSVKIAGAGPSSGIEDNYLDVDTSGRITVLLNDGGGTSITVGQKVMTSSVPVVIASNQSTINTQDLADGPVTPGTVATKSILTGMQYNTTPPAPTNTQQVAMQSTSDGRLKVDTSFSVLGGQLIPTITNKLRIRYSTTPATVGAAYSTIYTRSGTGLFFGFQTDFNSANVRLKLTIDSGIIFEITVADLKLFQFNDTTTTRMQMGGFWATVGNTVDFSVKYAIPYTSSVLIEMQRTDGTNHQMSQYMVILTEDT